MFLKENTERLKKIGLTADEIKKIKKTRWLIEYCKPTDLFLLKLAYYIKYGKPPLYEIIEGDEKTVSNFERNMKNIINVFSERCEETARNYMREHFDSFLFVKKEELRDHHFKVFTDFFLSLKGGAKAIYAFVDFRVRLFERKDVFLYDLRMNNCGVMWMGKKNKVWILAGPLTDDENIERIINNSIEFSDRIFGSEWWQKILNLLPLLKDMPESLKDYDEKIQKLQETKEWFWTLKTVKPALMKIKSVPLDLISQITMHYAKLLEEYMKM